MINLHTIYKVHGWKEKRDREKKKRKKSDEK